MQISSNATSLLHSLFGLEPRHLEKVLATALNGNASKGAYCDIYLEYGKSQGLSFDQNSLRSTSSSIVRGAGIRVVMGDKTGYSYTSHVNVTNLRKAATIAAAIAQYSKGQVESVQVGPDAPPAQHNLYEIGSSPVDAALKEKIDLLSEMNKEARAFDSRIVNLSASVQTSDRTIIIATSLGEVIVDQRPLVVLSTNCLAADGKVTESGTSGGGGRVEFGYLRADEFFRSHARIAAENAVNNLSAVAAPAGELTVVLGGGWPGVLLHEAVGHGLEGDFNRKGTSAFSGRVGEKVASDLCTVIDDGTMPNRRGSLNVDDEGTPTGRTVLIENGILKGYMQDRQNASLMKKSATGNGRRENYKCTPMPRMTNTFLAGGKSTPEEIIASVKYGIYAKTFGGGQVDITSGNFTFSATGAWLIENGKLTTPIKGATLIGNGPKAMQQVSMVGNDVALDTGIGTCGKNGQSVPVGVGMPTTRIDRVTVGGTGR